MGGLFRDNARRAGRVTLNKLMLAVTLLGSLYLLVSTLRRGRRQPATRDRRLVLGGALVLLWLALRVYWHSYDLYTHSYWGLLKPGTVALIFYLGWRLLAGATVATLTLSIFPKGAKLVLGISAAIFVASILLEISNRGPSRFAFIGNAWSIGMAIPSIVLMWLEANKKKQQVTTALGT